MGKVVNLKLTLDTEVADTLEMEAEKLGLRLNAYIRLILGRAALDIQTSDKGKVS